MFGLLNQYGLDGGPTTDLTTELIMVSNYSFTLLLASMQMMVYFIQHSLFIVGSLCF